MDTNAPRDRFASTTNDAGLQRPRIAEVATVIGPGFVVLVPPVAIGIAVQRWCLGQQRRDIRLTAKVGGLFGIKVIDSVAIDMRLPVRPIGRVDRFAIERKRRWAAEVCSGPRDRFVQFLARHYIITPQR